MSRLDIFVTGDDGLLYHRWWDGSGHQPGPETDGWEGQPTHPPLPGGRRIVGSPGVASWGRDRLGVFVTGGDALVYHVWWDSDRYGREPDGGEGQPTHPPLPGGRRIVGSPGIASWGRECL